LKPCGEPKADPEDSPLPDRTARCALDFNLLKNNKLLPVGHGQNPSDEVFGKTDTSPQAAAQRPENGADRTGFHGVRRRFKKVIEFSLVE